MLENTCAVCGTENLIAALRCAACSATLQSAADFGTAESSALGDDWSAQPTNATALDAATYEVLASGSTLRGGAITVQEVLGQGGFGITYRGWDASRGRAVAVKEFFPYGCVRRGSRVQPSSLIEAAEFDLARRAFHDESRFALRFRHAGIVEVLAVFEENNTAYLVMELLEGQTLLQMVEARGALPENEAVFYIEQVGLALETLHSADLLHRDIKPENIMVCPQGDAGWREARVVLLDFGAARSFAAGRTRRMTTLLTPGYAPLEQYGSRARFGRFTDIYALGATLFHLLTGQMPPSATDRISGEEWVAPEQINPNVGHLVSAGVEWAMQTKVDERPQSIPDWLRALRSGYRPQSITENSTSNALAPNVAPPQSTLPAGFLPASVGPPLGASPFESSASSPTSPPRSSNDLSPSAPPFLLLWERIERPIRQVVGAITTPVALGETGQDTAWHRVTVEVRRIKWPRQCACCGEATTAIWSMPTETATWELPYCVACQKHAEHGQFIEVAARSIAAGCVALGAILGLGFEMWSQAAAIGIAAPALGWLGGSYLLIILRRLQRERHETDCCDFVPAARYRGRKGDVFHWEFRRRDFAEAFLTVNLPVSNAPHSVAETGEEIPSVALLEAKVNRGEAKRSRVSL